MRLSNFFSLESEVTLPTDGVIPGTHLEPEESVIVDNTTFINTEENNIDAATAMSNSMDVAIEALEQTEDIVNVLSDYQEDGISAPAAELLQISLDDIYKRLDYQPKEELPSLESFRSVHTSGPAVRISIEGVMEFLHDLWKGIVNVFKKIWLAITGLFKGTLAKAEENRIESYTREINSYKKDISNVEKDSIPKNMEISDVYWCRVFTYPNEKASIKSIENIIGNNIKLAASINTLKTSLKVYIASVEHAVLSFSLCQQNINNVEKFKTALSDVVKVIEKELNPWYEKSFKTLSHPSKKDNEVKSFEENSQSKNTLTSDYLVSGNHFLFFKNPVRGMEIFSYTYNLVEESNNDNAVVQSIPFPTPNEFDYLCSLFIEFSNKLDSNLTIGEDIVNEITRIEKLLDDTTHTIQRIGNLDDDTRSRLIELTKETAATIHNLMKGPVLMVAAFQSQLSYNHRTIAPYFKKIHNVIMGVGRKKK